MLRSLFFSAACIAVFASATRLEDNDLLIDNDFELAEIEQGGDP